MPVPAAGPDSVLFELSLLSVLCLVASALLEVDLAVVGLRSLLPWDGVCLLAATSQKRSMQRQGTQAWTVNHLEPRSGANCHDAIASCVLRELRCARNPNALVDLAAAALRK
jgi:hypothetical protein